MDGSKNILNDRSYRKKNAYRMIPLIWHSEKGKPVGTEGQPAFPKAGEVKHEVDYKSV